MFHAAGAARSCIDVACRGTKEGFELIEVEGAAAKGWTKPRFDYGRIQGRWYQRLKKVGTGPKKAIRKSKTGGGKAKQSKKNK
jgi:hypothetical protein